ncbi:MAG: hypothetical protein HYZ29_17230 [Myxococcales bacterium]|nr:hypothetical protein [Myxococcales bacterium]
MFDLGSLWAYDERLGTWIKMRREELSQRVQSYSGKLVAGQKGPHPLKLKHSDVSGIVKTLNEKLSSPDFFEHASAGIAFSNGFLLATAEGSELRTHSPKNRATMRLGFAYNPSAAAPGFGTFLRDVFRDDADAAEKISLLQEHAGACLLGVAAKYQLAVVLLGSGANGKSTLLDIETGVFPPEWRASIPPHAWGHEYNRSLLPGIRINAVNELPDRELMASEMIKAIISGDEVQARFIREQPFTFRPIAGQLFAANDLPAVTDQSHGLWRRFVVVSFNRIFAEHEMVRGLAESILKEERAGIINWMLVGAQRLMQRASYTVPPSSDKIKDTWKKGPDSVASFIDEEMVPIADRPNGISAKKLGYMRAGEAYDEYTRYCRRNGYRSVSARKFAERLKVLGIKRAEDRQGRWYSIREREFDADAADAENQEPVKPLVN